MSARALRTLSKTPPQYWPSEGSPLLREVIAGHLSSTRAVASQAQGVLVTAGAQQAFDLLARVLVTPGNTVVAVEDPGYPPLREAFAMHGARLAYVPVDDEGIIVEQIPANARVVCVTPSHQFPTGVVMSVRRRAALLAFSRANEACIVEDDYDSEFRYDGRPLEALQTLDRDDLVFYLGTFSKSLFPALRIGFIIMPQCASLALTRAEKLTDWHAPIHTQETLASFIREGHFDRHARKKRRIYAERRTILMDALETQCVGVLSPMTSTAGLHIGVRYQGKRELESYLLNAAQRGLAFETFARYSYSGLKQNGLALGYSSITWVSIREGIEILHGILTAKPL